MEEMGYRKGTIAYSARILKDFFAFLRGRDEKCINPREIRTVRYTPTQKEIPNEGDIERMDDCLNEGFFEDLSKKLVIHILWDTGIRVSELCGLAISDVQETSAEGARTALIRRRKSFRYDQVVWGKETNRLFNLYLGLRLTMERVDTEALFVTRSKKTYGMPVTTRTVQRWIKDIAQVANIEKAITPHCFRHSKAHRVLDKSDNVRDVQAILGHAAPESSFKYLQIDKQKHYQVALKYL